MPKHANRTRSGPVQGGRRSFGKGKSMHPRSPVAKHAGINKASTHPDQTKQIPRFQKHKLHEAINDLTQSCISR